MTKALYTVVETAEILGISRTKVYSLLTSGSLESVHIGRLRRIPTDAISDYVASLR